MAANLTPIGPALLQRPVKNKIGREKKSFLILIRRKGRAS
jgi:hypothetical protein